MLYERIEVILILVLIITWILIKIVTWILVKIIAWILIQIALFLIKVDVRTDIFYGFGFVILEEIVHDFVSKVFIHVFTAVILNFIIVCAILRVLDVFLTQ